MVKKILLISSCHDCNLWWCKHQDAYRWSKDSDNFTFPIDCSLEDSKDD